MTNNLLIFLLLEKVNLWTQNNLELFRKKINYKINYIGSNGFNWNIMKFIEIHWNIMKYVEI